MTTSKLCLWLRPGGTCSQHIWMPNAMHWCPEPSPGCCWSCVGRLLTMGYGSCSLPAFLPQFSSAFVILACDILAVLAASRSIRSRLHQFGSAHFMPCAEQGAVHPGFPHAGNGKPRIFWPRVWTQGVKPQPAVESSGQQQRTNFSIWRSGTDAFVSGRRATLGAQKRHPPATWQQRSRALILYTVQMQRPFFRALITATPSPTCCGSRRPFERTCLYNTAAWGSMRTLQYIFLWVNYNGAHRQQRKGL
jgi:hypothetical protein